MRHFADAVWEANQELHAECGGKVTFQGEPINYDDENFRKFVVNLENDYFDFLIIPPVQIACITDYGVTHLLTRSKSRYAVSNITHGMHPRNHTQKRYWRLCIHAHRQNGFFFFWSIPGSLSDFCFIFFSICLDMHTHQCILFGGRPWRWACSLIYTACKHHVMHINKTVCRQALDTGKVPVGGLILTWAGNKAVNTFADIIGKVVLTSRCDYMLQRTNDVYATNLQISVETFLWSLACVCVCVCVFVCVYTYIHTYIHT